VGRHAASGQYVHVFVARATRNGLLSFEIVRTVAADAFLMAVCEERCGRHDGFLLGVTGLAGPERVPGRGVQVLVARGAHGNRGLSVACMRRGHLLVAAGARAGLRLFVVVWTVALRALAGAVNGDCGRVSLPACVTARALARLEDVQRQVVVGARVVRAGIAAPCFANFLRPSSGVRVGSIQ